MTTPHTHSNTAAPAQPSATLTASIASECEDVPGYVNRGELPYDYSDLCTTAEELQAKFAETGEHEYYTRGQWQGAVDMDTTTQGYWEWVLHNIAEDDEAY